MKVDLDCGNLSPLPLEERKRNTIEDNNEISVIEDSALSASSKSDRKIAGPKFKTRSSKRKREAKKSPDVSKEDFKKTKKRNTLMKEDAGDIPVMETEDLQITGETCPLFLPQCETNFSF